MSSVKDWKPSVCGRHNNQSEALLISVISLMSEFDTVYFVYSQKRGLGGYNDQYGIALDLAILIPGI